MDFYLNVSLMGLSTKNDRCQDVTTIDARFVFLWDFEFFEKRTW